MTVQLYAMLYEIRPPQPDLTDDTPLTVGLLRELLQDATRIMHMPGRCASRFDLALREAIEERIQNEWA